VQDSPITVISILVLQSEKKFVLVVLVEGAAGRWVSRLLGRGMQADAHPL